LVKHAKEGSVGGNRALKETPAAELRCFVSSLTADSGY
jgi:hypothetical protein